MRVDFFLGKDMVSVPWNGREYITWNFETEQHPEPDILYSVLFKLEVRDYEGGLTGDDIGRIYTVYKIEPVPEYIKKQLNLKRTIKTRIDKYKHQFLYGN